MEQNYLQLLKEILDHGEKKEDRTGTGTLSIFGTQSRYDLSQSFPVLTTKKLHLRSIIHELLWFIKGDTNIRYLNDHQVTIWDEWADDEGDLGPIYGYQWRHWGKKWTKESKYQEGGVDQIEILLEQLKKNPHSRRHIVSAWNVADLGEMKLPPCHVLFQFYVHGDRRLSCQLYQRSADVFLGVPFNIASYSLLTLMMAQVCDMKPGHFVHTIGDAHLYLNHLEQAKLQLTREPRPFPQMKINPAVRSLFDFCFEDFELTGYDPHSTIKAPISV